MAMPMPISVEAEFSRLTALAQEVPDEVRSTAYHDLGGNVAFSVDERAKYLAHVAYVAEDIKKAQLNPLHTPRPLELIDGICRLGVTALTPKILSGLSVDRQEGYADELSSFLGRSKTRARLLLTEGNIEGPLQRFYPGADQSWASDYGAKLRNFTTILEDSSLYAMATGIRRKPYRQTVPHPLSERIVAVGTNQKGELDIQVQYVRRLPRNAGSVRHVS